MRSTPDVSADADPSTGILLVCLPSQHSTCQPAYLEGGTSMAAPEWAAGAALLGQVYGRLGHFDAALYVGLGPTNDFWHLGLGSFDLGKVAAAIPGLYGISPPTLTPTPSPTLTPTPSPSPTSTPSPTPTASPSPTPSSTPSPGPAPSPGSAVQVLTTPARLIDTRQSGSAIGSGTARCFTLAGQAGIPADAAGVVLNVTSVGYTAPGWVTLYPAGQSVPATSTLNFDPHAYAIANGVIARLGSGGQVCAFVGTLNAAPGSAQIILDATGYISASGAAALPLLMQPQRLVDTRLVGGPIASGQSRCFQMAGVAGIPADAVGVALNVAAVGYTSPGWLTIYSSDQSVPATSTLNVDPHTYAIANGSIARLGPNGTLCVNFGTIDSAPGSAHAILDVVGYLTSSGAAKIPLLAQPQRLVDTRLSGGPIASGQSRCFTVAGLSGVPANAVGLLVNVTGVGYTVPGWLTLYPNGQNVPATSTVNEDPNMYAIANGAIARIGAGGQVCVNVGTVNGAPAGSHVILDATGVLLP